MSIVRVWNPSAKPRLDQFKFKYIKETDEYQLFIDGLEIIKVPKDVYDAFQSITQIHKMEMPKREKFYLDNKAHFDKLCEHKLISTTITAHEYSQTIISKKDNKWEFLISGQEDTIGWRRIDIDFIVGVSKRICNIPIGTLMILDGKEHIATDSEICMFNHQEIKIIVDNLKDIPKLYQINTQIYLMGGNTRLNGCDLSADQFLENNKLKQKIAELNAKIDQLTANPNLQIANSDIKTVPLYDVRGELIAKVAIADKTR